MIRNIQLCLFGLLFLLLGCEEEDLSTEKEILSFAIEGTIVPVGVDVDTENGIIYIYADDRIDLTALVPSITVSSGATISPESGILTDFSQPLTYIVTAENGTKRTYGVEIADVPNRILSFSLQGRTEAASVNGSSIQFNLPYGVNATSLIPIITVQPGATVSPASGSTVDFTEPVIFTVTPSKGATRQYVVTVNVDPGSNANSLLSISMPDLFQSGVITGNNVEFQLPYGTNLSSINLSASISEKATVNPSLSGTVDLTQPLTLEVISQSGLKNTYTITASTEAENPEAIRGVWLTNVASNAMASYANIKSSVQLIDELGFNTIFAVVWNKTLTLHPSQVLRQTVASFNPSYDGRFYPNYDAGRDPLQDLIDESHARGIKVMAWFEYGFASQFGAGNTGGRNAVLLAHPEWESRNSSGQMVEKNSFYWMNGFHPEVQQFMIDLVVEVVNNYDIDGIQGDDRLPAMPSTAGYDDYTVQRYQSEHGGSSPPANYADGNWKKWRANILSDFGQNLYNAVKQADPNCWVTFSPSIWTFGYDEYLQDYPEWIKRGFVDLISPQLYRYENAGIGVYENLLKNQLFGAIGSANIDIYAPGVLLAVGGYIPSETYLANLIKTNRKNGIQGEVYFFFEGIKVRQKVFKAFYPVKSLFPVK